MGTTASTPRRNGAELAAYAGLELGQSDLLDRLATAEGETRVGAARLCASLLPRTANPVRAAALLGSYFDDEHTEVQTAAASVATALRGRNLRPHRQLLTLLIGSRTFDSALSQLLITLEDAPDKNEELVALTAERVLAHDAPEVGDITKRASAHAPHLARILLRAYSQTRNRAMRSRLLDSIDTLQRNRAIGIDELVETTARGQSLQ